MTLDTHFFEEMESRIPKPTSIKAILPEIPKIVINRRFL